MSVPFRNGLTDRQREGLHRRALADPQDCLTRTIEVGIGSMVSASLHEPDVIVVEVDGGVVNANQAEHLKKAIDEVKEFLIYGPGEWADGLTCQLWVSALDEDGNDRTPTEETT